MYHVQQGSAPAAHTKSLAGTGLEGFFEKENSVWEIIKVTQTKQTNNNNKKQELNGGHFGAKILSFIVKQNVNLLLLQCVAGRVAACRMSQG